MDESQEQQPTTEDKLNEHVRVCTSRADELHVTIKKSKIWGAVGVIAALIGNIVTLSVTYGKWQVREEQHAAVIKRLEDNIPVRDQQIQDLQMKAVETGDKVDQLRMDLKDLRDALWGQVRRTRQAQLSADHTGSFRP